MWVKVETSGTVFLNTYTEDACEEPACDHAPLTPCVNVAHEGSHSSGILTVWLSTVKWSAETVYEYGVDVAVYGVIGKGND